MENKLPMEIILLIMSFLNCKDCGMYFFDTNGVCRRCEALMMSGMC